MPSTLRVATLNVGRFLQERTRVKVREIAQREDAPEVMLVQDLPFRDLPLFERWPHVAYAPMTNHLINGERAVVGIAILSRYFLAKSTHHTTWGDGVLKNLEGINEKNERHLGAESDRLVEKTEDRVLICAIVIKNGQCFSVATTHGMWTRGGVTNEVQKVTAARLLRVLSSEFLFPGGSVVGGDMNFPRGGEIYQKFVECGIKDCILPVETTLDPDHPLSKRGIKVVSDYFFTTGSCYRISDVSVDGGISDHCMISANLSWI